MSKDTNLTIGCIIDIIVILLLMFITPFIVSFIFNTWLAGLFGIASLTYWQAFALYVFCSIIFKPNRYIPSNLMKKIYKTSENEYL